MGSFRNTACLISENVLLKKVSCVVKFRKLVAGLYEMNHLTATEADKAKDQFESFVEIEVKKCADEFSSFQLVDDRLDKFYGRWFYRKEKCAALWKVMIFVFTLSHGQAQIERGFNKNSDLLVENLESRSIVAQRRVYDHLAANESSPTVF